MNTLISTWWTHASVGGSLIVGGGYGWDKIFLAPRF